MSFGMAVGRVLLQSPNLVGLAHVWRAITTLTRHTPGPVSASARHEAPPPKTKPVCIASLWHQADLSLREAITGSYINENETYTFVPVEPVGARSLTVYRNSGDIVLNGE